MKEKEYVVKLAEEIQKSVPNAKLSVIVEVKDTSPGSIELLSSKGLEIHGVINRLNVVTGEIPVAKAKAMSQLSIVKEVSPSRMMELLRGSNVF